MFVYVPQTAEREKIKNTENHQLLAPRQTELHHTNVMQLSLQSKTEGTKSKGMERSGLEIYNNKCTRTSNVRLVNRIMLTMIYKLVKKKNFV